jgi:hypothetical protein
MAVRTGSTSGKNQNVLPRSIKPKGEVVVVDKVDRVDRVAADRVDSVADVAAVPVAAVSVALAVAEVASQPHHKPVRPALSLPILKHLLLLLPLNQPLQLLQRQLLLHPPQLPNRRSSKELGREPSVVA